MNASVHLRRGEKGKARRIWPMHALVCQIHWALSRSGHSILFDLTSGYSSRLFSIYRACNVHPLRSTHMHLQLCRDIQYVPTCFFFSFIPRFAPRLLLTRLVISLIHFSILARPTHETQVCTQYVHVCNRLTYIHVHAHPALEERYRMSMYVCTYIEYATDNFPIPCNFRGGEQLKNLKRKERAE